MLKDMQYIIKAVEEKLASMELMQDCYQEQCKQKEETIKVKEAQLEDAEKRIGELEEALRRLKDGGVKDVRW